MLREIYIKMKSSFDDAKMAIFFPDRWEKCEEFLSGVKINQKEPKTHISRLSSGKRRRIASQENLATSNNNFPNIKRMDLDIIGY